jgi:hypothetical protein
MREINRILSRERCILLHVTGMPRFQIRREKRVVHKEGRKKFKPTRERNKEKKTHLKKLEVSGYPFQS